MAGQRTAAALTAACLLYFAVIASGKKIFPVRPMHLRKLQEAAAAPAMTGPRTIRVSGLGFNFPGLSGSITTDNLVSSVGASMSVSVPQPLRNTSATTAPTYVIINQEYLPGGELVPMKGVAGTREEGTFGRKPAMIKGLPLPKDTGVSLTAKPVTVRASVDFASSEGGAEGGAAAAPNADVSTMPQAGIKFHGGAVIYNPKVINIYYGNWDTCPSKSGAQPPATSASAAPAAAAAVDLLDALTTISFREAAAGTAGRRLAEAGDSEEDLPDAGEDNETRPGGSGQNGTTGPVANVACSNSAVPLIYDDFVKSLGGTCWMNIASTYYDKDGKYLSDKLTFGGSLKVPVGDPCYQGSKLSDAQLFAVVTCLLDSNRVEYGLETLYMVVTASEVSLTSGFCSQYCGWHDHGTWNNKNVRFSFIGSALQCPSACMEQQKTSPNAIPEVDGLASIGAHEIIEWITDPDGDAWYDDRGEENADKCAWNFGKTAPIGNAYYNVGPYKCMPDQGCTETAVRDGRYFLVQQNWVNKDNGYCSLSYKS